MKFVIYFLYGHSGGISNCGMKVTFFEWLFPIFAHNKLVKELTEKGKKNVNIIWQTRSLANIGVKNETPTN